MEWLDVPKKRQRGVHMRHRKDWRQHLIEGLRPSMGYKATLRWVLLKLRREAADPHKVAWGAAIGMWINFIPIPGLGAASALVLAWLLRGSLMAAFIGQILGNPWTFPLIWWMNYAIGRVFIPVKEDALGFNQLMENANLDFVVSHWQQLATNVLPPLFMGGLILGTAVGGLTYALVYWEVRQFWKHRRAKWLVKHGVELSRKGRKKRSLAHPNKAV